MKHIHRGIAVLTCMTWLLAAAASQEKEQQKKDIKVRGYVTAVNSPRSFEVEDYRVTRAETIELEIEDEKAGLALRPQDLRIGTRVEIRGTYYPGVHELSARKVKVSLKPFKKFKQTTILSRRPEGLEQTEQGWRGILLADGRRIRIEPTTEVRFKLTKAEREALAQSRKESQPRKEKAKSPPEDEVGEEGEHRPLRSPEEIGPGTIMTYHGMLEPEGTVLADRVEFMRYERTKGEERLWRSHTPSVKMPLLQEGKSGSLSAIGVGKYKLLPSREVQDYVSQVGQSLIPAWQRALPEGDPAKIPFRFFVATDKYPNALALPDGTVVVTSAMIEALENEAQLAAVLGHEIAHAEQRHMWRQQQYRSKERLALRLGAIAATAATGNQGAGNLLLAIEEGFVIGYGEELESQADRIGLEYLVAAGYDPRESRRVWKLMDKKVDELVKSAPLPDQQQFRRNRSADFFWSNVDNQTTRQSYLMLEIRNNHAQLDFNQTRKNEAAFQSMAKLAREATARKK